jgi:ribosomal peptide maturation radical SAM protein 1
MNRLKVVKKKICSVLTDGDILLIVPPFTTNSSALGPHILQAVAREKGYKTEILYANLVLASILGVEFSEKLGTSGLLQYWSMLNERLFARSAYGLPPLGKSPGSCHDEARSVSGRAGHHRQWDFDGVEPIDLKKYLEVEEICNSFVNEVVQAVVSFQYKIVGCTVRMGQTNCGIALINGIKRISPGIVTIIGGANCSGEMAEGIASLSDAIDYVFSGESELAFAEFLSRYSSRQLPSRRILPGIPVENLDTLPVTDYESYFRQVKHFLGRHDPVMTYAWSETSRGCWWGQKKKCVFCSRNNDGIKSRAKSPGRVLAELASLKTNHPNVPVAMADNIMPFSYYKELLPRLAEKKAYPPIYLYYMKANLKLADLINLKKARVAKIVPGIETLSTGMLKLLNKGVTAGENLRLLRNARSVGINLLWFMLWGVPGDKAEYYEEILAILPLIRHLQPPHKFFHVHLERFSAYCEKPGEYKIENLRPWEVYKMIYPEGADLNKLAFEYTGDYPCEAYEHPGLIREIAEQLAYWRKTWKSVNLVMLAVAGCYLVHDTRNPAEEQNHSLDAARAREIMTYGIYNQSPGQKWALEQKLGVVVDSRYVPLVTAEPGLLTEFAEPVN